MVRHLGRTSRTLREGRQANWQSPKRVQNTTAGKNKNKKKCSGRKKILRDTHSEKCIYVGQCGSKNVDVGAAVAEGGVAARGGAVVGQPWSL